MPEWFDCSKAFPGATGPHRAARSFTQMCCSQSILSAGQVQPTRQKSNLDEGGCSGTAFAGRGSPYGSEAFLPSVNPVFAGIVRVLMYSAQRRDAVERLGAAIEHNLNPPTGNVVEIGKVKKSVKGCSRVQSEPCR